MRKWSSTGAGPSLEDSDTDETCRNPNLDPYLRNLCFEYHKEKQAELAGAESGVNSCSVESETPFLDSLEAQGYGPKASPTYTEDVYDKHAAALEDTQLNLSGHGQSIDRLDAVWEQHREKYEDVAGQTDLPAELIAALHYRESSFNFNTYLHQGDPLGEPAVHWPRNIPVFHSWSPAAIHALGLKKGVQEDVGLTKESDDLAAMATYAEYYNGLGYHNRGIESPYVYGGTDQYSSGHYVADGKFDPDAKDRRLGVIAIVRHLKGAITESDMAGLSRLPFAAGDRMLSVGDKGADVKVLQELLSAAGVAVAVDGELGPKTDEAIRVFQEQSGLEIDGVVGPRTLQALEQSSAQQVCPVSPEP
jgi:lysozyme family protein